LKIKNVVFADMDGTFLNDKYDYTETKPIVNQLTALGGSIVFCSSKTSSEIDFYRKAIGNSHLSLRTAPPYSFLNSIFPSAMIAHIPQVTTLFD
jgi:ribonucleotide monophosphatase NagD (HAD superfamily)